MNNTMYGNARWVTPIKEVLHPEILQDLHAAEIQAIIAILQALTPQGGEISRTDNQMVVTQEDNAYPTAPAPDNVTINELTRLSEGET